MTSKVSEMSMHRKSFFCSVDESNNCVIDAGVSESLGSGPPSANSMRKNKNMINQY